jgi:hypothetical protein
VILHRSRTWRLELVVVAIAAAAVAWAVLLLRRDVSAGLPVWVTGRELVACSAAFIALVVLAVRVLSALRFRFVIDSVGLTIRTGYLTAAVRWSDVESIVLDDLRILVVPAPAYGRTGSEVLALSHVRERPDQIASALAEHAGPRFTDARTR